MNDKTSISIPITCDPERRLRYMPMAQLAEFQGDLKELTEDGYARLKSSILKHGFFAPVFIWGDKILDGHQRKRVLEREGWQLDGEGVPVVEIDAPDEQAAGEILLQLTGQHGHLTPQGLYEFIEDKGIEPDNLVEFDLPTVDVDTFLAEYYQDTGGATEPDEVPEPPEEPVSQRGDLWLMGDHRLLCGDSTDEGDVTRLMDGQRWQEYTGQAATLGDDGRTFAEIAADRGVAVPA